MNENMTQLINDYIAFLKGKAPSTQEAYARILTQMSQWMTQLPGQNGDFHLNQLTKTAVTAYLGELKSQGYSGSHRSRVKAVISSFSQWALDQHPGKLIRNPAHGIKIQNEDKAVSRELDAEQRYILPLLVEREDSLRGAAIFALGYWAGCRVSDVSWLRKEDCTIGPKVGWITVGHKGGKQRDIDLLNEVRRPLYQYLQSTERNQASPYVFTSQREERLSEAGIHHWFRQLKQLASHDEWPFIENVTFHDLRHDFAHRARQAGWQLEDIAYYLGHSTGQGIPNLQTTVRYTQVNRQTIKAKLHLFKGE